MPTHTFCCVSARSVCLVKLLCEPLIRTEGGCGQSGTRFRRSASVCAGVGVRGCLCVKHWGLGGSVNAAVFTGGLAPLEQHIWNKCWNKKNKIPGCRGKYCFYRGAKRKVQSRQTRMWLVYLPLPHTHTHAHTHGYVQSTESLSLHALYSEFPLRMSGKCQPPWRISVCTAAALEF